MSDFKKNSAFDRMNHPDFPFDQSPDALKAFARMKDPNWPFTEEEQQEQDKKARNRKRVELIAAAQNGKKNKTVIEESEDGVISRREMLTREGAQVLGSKTRRIFDYVPENKPRKEPAPSDDLQLQAVKDLLAENKKLEGAWKLLSIPEIKAQPLTVEEALKESPGFALLGGVTMFLIGLSTYFLGNDLLGTVFLASSSAFVIAVVCAGAATLAKQHKKKTPAVKGLKYYRPVAHKRSSFSLSTASASPMYWSALQARAHKNEEKGDTDRFAVNIVSDSDPYRLQIAQYSANDSKHMWMRIILDEVVSTDLLKATERTVEVAALAAGLEEQARNKALTQQQIDDLNHQMEKEDLREKELNQKTLLQALQNAAGQTKTS